MRFDRGLPSASRLPGRFPGPDPTLLRPHTRPPPRPNGPRGPPRPDRPKSKRLSVKRGAKVRHLRTHGLEEGVSTRLLIYAGTLIRQGVAAPRACEVAVTKPITDDHDMQRSIAELIKAIF